MPRLTNENMLGRHILTIEIGASKDNQYVIGITLSINGQRLAGGEWLFTYESAMDLQVKSSTSAGPALTSATSRPMETMMTLGADKYADGD